MKIQPEAGWRARARARGLGLGLHALLAIATWNTAMPARADFVSLGSGDYGGLPLYRALVFGGIDTLAGTSPGYLPQDILDGIDYVSNTQPMALATGGGTRSASGATLSGNGWSAWSGMLASRNHASIQVSNAQVTDDYYLVAGQGGTTRLHFAANAPAASATFTWHVSGNATTAGPGTASARLDFTSTTSPGTDWIDVLFGAAETAMTAFGPGTHQYTVPLTGQDQDVFLYWWTSAYTLLSHDTFAQGSGASLTAGFGSTFVLADVQVNDADGNPLSQWSLSDPDTNEVVFDQDGRQAAVADAPAVGTVPAPGTAALGALALGLLGWRGRPGRRARQG